MKVYLHQTDKYNEYKKSIIDGDVVVDTIEESDVVLITQRDMEVYIMPYCIDHPVLSFDLYAQNYQHNHR